jgi:hypothetical protein
MKNRARRAAKALAGVARWCADQLVDQAVEKRTGLVPITSTRPNDVFICGYPKSGNTWFQHMVAAVVYGADVELAPDSLLNDLVPDVHFRTYYRRYGETCFFKSHHLPQPAYRRIVYLLRDGRDAMVSYFHHLTAMSGHVDFREMVASGQGLPGKWHEHVDGYLTNSCDAEVIVIRYEDLKRDAARQLRRFCEFAQLDRLDAVLVRAADKASFDKMRRKEQLSGWENPWPKDKPFIRRGAVGSFKDEMPPEVLSAFLRDAGRTLQAHGYAVAADSGGGGSDGR